MTQAAERCVLLVTHSRDFFTVDRVAEGLVHRGVRPIRFDTDRFPLEVRLGLAFDQQGNRPHLILADGEPVPLDRLVAVWIRKLGGPQLPEELEPELLPGCVAESQATLQGLFELLGPLPTIDPLHRYPRAESKPWQLLQAQEVGLTIPRTLISNDPVAVRRFADELDGRLVAKLLCALSHSMGEAPLFMHTSVVRPEDLAELDSLQYSPMVFQEQVAKAQELRVVVVGRRIFVGALDASGSAAGQVDWRQAQPTEVGWRHGTLPEEVARRLLALMQRLGLRYGASDFIVTPTGEHVFLEINPSGEWGMLEHDLGLPIGDALAAELLEEA